MKLNKAGTLWLFLLAKPNYHELMILDINISFEGKTNRNVDYKAMFAAKIDRLLYYETL